MSINRVGASTAKESATNQRNERTIANRTTEESKERDASFSVVDNPLADDVKSAEKNEGQKAPSIAGNKTPGIRL